ncbi:MAG: FUSC family protein [Lachnospiraceae bacterium]|nr:FUSC family protein [Lachnospiraceae bacterium]
MMSDEVNRLIKKRLKNLKPMLYQAIAPTIVATLIFFLTYYFLGAENTVLDPIVTLAFLRFRTMQYRYESMIRTFAVFFAMALVSYFAVMNLPLCIILNAAALFWIAYVHIDEYHPDNYFPAGMALIFFQVSPATNPLELGNRMLALLGAFVIVLVCIFILTKIRRRTDPLPEYIREGFENCRRQLDLCEAYQNAAGGDPSASETESYKELSVLRQELVEINKKCSDVIYAYNRASIRPKGKTNWYCRFILCFQVINYLTMYFKEEQNLAEAKKLYRDFLELFETAKPKADYRRLHLRLRKPDIRSFRLRFALRQMITLTPCLAFALISGIPNIYWVVISVFFMMIPFTNHTLERIRQRVLGTVGGVLVCLLLFTIFDGFAARVVIMVIANFCLYGSTGYAFTVAYITCAAMALPTLNDPMHMMLLYRVLYTLVGAGIALLANLFIFPIRLQRQIEYVSEMIEGLHREMTENSTLDRSADSKSERAVDQLVLRSFLLINRLETMCDALPLDELTFEYRSFEKKHMFIMEQYLTRQFLKN